MSFRKHKNDKFHGNELTASKSHFRYNRRTMAIFSNIVEVILLLYNSSTIASRFSP